MYEIDKVATPLLENQLRLSGDILQPLLTRPRVLLDKD
jgi:hypothetical protein